MEKQYENDRMIFENFCDTVRKLASSMGSGVIESFNSEKLPVKERPGRISLDILQVTDELEDLNRPDYITYRNDNTMLFEIFKNAGNLTNAEEMNKLQQVMIHSELFLQLQVLALHTNFMKKTAKKMKKHDTGDREQATIPLHQVFVRLQDYIHLVKSPSNLHDFSKIITCHDWSTMKVKIYFGCQTNEVKCVIDCFQSFNPDLTYANIGRSGLFISKRGRPIKAHDLTTSSCIKLKSRTGIEKIIAGYQKKG